MKHWRDYLALIFSILAVVFSYVHILPDIEFCNDTFIGLIATFIGISVAILIGFQIYNVLDFKEKLKKMEDVDNNLQKTKIEIAKSIYLANANSLFGQRSVDLLLLINKYSYSTICDYSSGKKDSKEEDKDKLPQDKKADLNGSNTDSNKNVDVCNLISSLFQTLLELIKFDSPQISPAMDMLSFCLKICNQLEFEESQQNQIKQYYDSILECKMSLVLCDRFKVLCENLSKRSNISLVN